jgi:hypothetical protein
MIVAVIRITEWSNLLICFDMQDSTVYLYYSHKQDFKNCIDTVYHGELIISLTFNH